MVECLVRVTVPEPRIRFGGWCFYILFFFPLSLFLYRYGFMDGRFLDLISSERCVRIPPNPFDFYSCSFFILSFLHFFSSPHDVLCIASAGTIFSILLFSAYNF